MEAKNEGTMRATMGKKEPDDELDKRAKERLIEERRNLGRSGKPTPPPSAQETRPLVDTGIESRGTD
jgi:hypothetical protein